MSRIILFGAYGIMEASAIESQRRTGRERWGDVEVHITRDSLKDQEVQHNLPYAMKVANIIVHESRSDWPDPDPDVLASGRSGGWHTVY